MKRLLLITMLCVGMSVTSGALTQRSLEIYDMLSELVAVYDPIFYDLQSQCNAPPNVWLFVKDFSCISQFNMGDNEDFNTRFGLYYIYNGVELFLLIHNDTTFIYKTANGFNYNSTLTHMPSRMLNDMIDHLIRIKRTDPEAMTEDMFMNIIYNLYSKPKCRVLMLEKEYFIEYGSFYLYLEGNKQKDAFWKWVNHNNRNESLNH